MPRPVIRTTACVAALALVGAGCGGGASSCDDIADEAIVVLQETIDIVDGFSENELNDFATSGNGAPQAFIDVQQRGDELVAEADAVGCSDSEITDLLVAKSGQLQAESDFGQFVVETLRTGAFFSNE